MAKIKLSNFDSLNLNEEIKAFMTEKAPISLKFGLSKIFDDVKRQVELVTEAQKEFPTEEKRGDDDNEVAMYTAEGAEQNKKLLFDDFVEIEYTPLKMRDIKDLVTDKPYHLIFKFFV